MGILLFWGVGFFFYLVGFWGFFFCLNQSTQKNKDLPVMCISKGSHQQLSATKGGEKSNPRNQCKQWGSPSLALWAMWGQSRWHEACSQSLHVPWHVGMSLQQVWLVGPCDSVPCFPCLLGRPTLQGDPSSSPAPHPSSWHAGSAQRCTAHTVQTDAQTPTCAHGRVPTRVEVTTHGLSACWTAIAPHLPPVTAGSGSIASGLWVPLGLRSQCGEEPLQARWALTGTSRAMHPPAVQPPRNKTPCTQQSQWHFFLQGCLQVPAALRRRQSTHLPTSLNQGKRS